jgi:hypothetical protein
MNKYSDPDPGSGIKHPGSATLMLTILNVFFMAFEVHISTYFSKTGRLMYF